MGVLDLFRLDGQRALITGCSRGIGFAMAVALAEAGADIVGVTRTLQPGSDIEIAVRAAGRNFRAFRADLGKREDVYRLLTELGTDKDGIDILVNNAGRILRRPASEHPDDYWDEIIETNLNSQFILSREIGRGMVARRRGKIIFISSLLAFQGGINVPGYAASKGALAQLTKALANEWAPFNVQVNAIAPGYVVTDNTAGLREDPVRAASITSRIPAGRWGSPDDFKGAVVLLASKASDYMNGSIVVIDGGWLAR